MPMLSITPVKPARNTATILAEDIELPKFDTVQTALDSIGSDNVEASKKYLELKRVSQIDASYNEAVAKYTAEYELASFNIQRQANIAAQDTRMQMSEGIGGKLGTGALSDINADITAEIETSAEAQQGELFQQFTDTLESIGSEYGQVITDLLGENFSKLLEYNENVDLFSMALLEEIAASAGWEYTDNTTLLKVLAEHDIITPVGDTGEYTVTATGQNELSKILLTVDTRYGDYTSRLNRLTANMVESVMAKRYPTLKPEDEAYKNKSAVLSEEINEWLSENATTMYYTDLGLAKFEGESLVVTDTPSLATPPEVAAAAQNAGATDSGMYIYDIGTTPEKLIEFFGEYKDSDEVDSKQTLYLQSILTAAKNGEIPNGSYFVANYGAAKDPKILFYYSDNRIYKTKYELGKNGPDIIDLNAIYGLDAAGSYLEEYDRVKSGKVPAGSPVIFGDKENEYFCGPDGLLYKFDKYEYDKTTGTVILKGPNFVERIFSGFKAARFFGKTQNK